MNRVKATRKQISEMNRLLDINLAKRANGTYAYLMGWSDERVASVASKIDPTGPTLNNKHAQTARKELYGTLTRSVLFKKKMSQQSLPLVISMSKPTSKGHVDTINEQASTIATLRDELTQLRKSHNAVLQWIRDEWKVDLTA